MTDLHDSQWIEKYRPSSFENLISDNKEAFQKLLLSGSTMPSLIFYSSKPGTGKTSTAKLIIQTLGCDSTCLNSSLDRSIDNIRDEVNGFVRCRSTVPGVKRCVFLDEADGLTRQAQDSLRNLMEEFSDNAFFILTANDVNKIIEPIRSRCQIFCFEKPSKANIMVRLDEICEAESLNIPPEILAALVDKHYPDLRKMIGALQMVKIKGTIDALDEEEQRYQDFLSLLKLKELTKIKQAVYSGDLDLLAFNNWFFQELYDGHVASTNLSKMALHAANVEKYASLNCNLELVFMAEYHQIMGLL